ncbi:transcriptional regulator, TraR/DksA family [Shewanella halifaxensis HAW-EB4]|uniref:Transcriptional regulator, TraR/DksA family n=1 Tax=Shewanella halifaxensis (strain HAW-EB4) TaxID=458817 RepID=B0TKI8_SHEHH|nr:DksA/TraR family C4-type zinc finger protein [Shewanella halifaxensis]ABZ78574.1 transcriptional regulator, TraR/DksA family [Shewanella halifaxensis HAW-EB4]
MAGGWSRDGAVQDQIDSSVEDAVATARSRLVGGVSLLHCEECGEEIPEARRIAVPGVRLCIHCQNELDSTQAKQHLFNRRGSKDSQLR